MSIASLSSQSSIHEALTRDSLFENTDNEKSYKRTITDNDDEFEALVQNYIKNGPNASSLQITANILYAMINPILVALPMASYCAGIPIFILTIIVISTISCYTNSLIVSMAVECDVNSYEELCDKAFGIKGYVSICLLQIFYSLSLMYISLSVWGDVISSIIVTDFPSVDNAVSKHITIDSFVLYIGAIVVLPFCVRKSMVSLQWTSYAVVIAIMTALVSVVIAFSSASKAHHKTEGNPYRNILNPTDDWWISIFVIMICFSYNQKVFAIHTCFRNNQNTISKKWNSILKKAHVLLGAVYIIFGIFGSLTVLNEGSSFSTNFFLETNDLSTNNKTFFINIVRFVVSFSLLLSAPGHCLSASATSKRMFKRFFMKEIARTTNTNINSLKNDNNNDNNNHYKLLCSNDNNDCDSNLENTNRISDGSCPVNISDDLSETTHSGKNSSSRDESVNKSEGSRSNFSKRLIPGAFLWLLTLILTLNIEDTSMLICFLGSLAACFLVLILPSMCYFRIGLNSDFASTPIIRNLIPNKLFMYIIQLIGMLFLAGEVGMFIFIMLPNSNNILKD